MAPHLETVMRTFLFITIVLGSLMATYAEPLPIDPLWKSVSFRKTITASYGIDSRIEPRITEDEAFYLDQSAAQMSANDRTAAVKTLRESSLLSDSPAMLFSLATLEFEAEEEEESLKHFASAIEQFPNFRDAHRNLAVALIRTEEFEKAKEHLVRAIELGSREGLTSGLLGYCHARNGHHQAALDAYRLAMLTQPEERQWRIGEAQALQSLGRPREAASIYQSLIDDTPTEMVVWLTQADSWIALDEPLRAASNLELVHRTGALDASATLSLGHLYLQNQLPDLAFERYQAAIAASEPVHFSRAVEALEMLVDSGEWERGNSLAALLENSDTYRREIESENADHEILSRLTRSRALLELETGEAEAGALRVEEWLRVEPLDGQALILLARFREDSGNREEAEMLLEQAARVPASAAAAHLAHGRLLVAEAEYTEAIRHLETAYELDPRESIGEYIKAVRELAP